MPTPLDRKTTETGFWGHIDELRKRLILVVVFFFLVFILAFSFRSILFDAFLLRLLDPNFITYQWFCDLGQWTGIEDLCPGQIGFKLININLAGQFMAHITVSALAAFIIALPLMVHQLWRFIKPALYPVELRSIRRSIWFIVLLFWLGAALGYFFLTPFSIIFLGNYQVSELVSNQITLSSYMGVFSTTVVMSGLLFELPLVFIVLARIGLVTHKTMRRWRRYVIVACLVLSAIITPSTDPFSMVLLAMPLYLLFEITIIFVNRIERRGAKTNS